MRTMPSSLSVFMKKLAIRSNVVSIKVDNAASRKTLDDESSSSTLNTLNSSSSNSNSSRWDSSSSILDSPPGSRRTVRILPSSSCSRILPSGTNSEESLDIFSMAVSDDVLPVVKKQPRRKRKEEANRWDSSGSRSDRVHQTPQHVAQPKRSPERSVSPSRSNSSTSLLL
jgi:hypothetical protein